MLRFTFALMLLFGALCTVQAQTASDSSSTGSDVYRPKAAEFSVEGLMDYQTYSSREGQGMVENQVDIDRLYKAKIAVPIVLREKSMFGVQLKYYQHRFFFEEDYVDDGGLYAHLNRTRFTSTGARAFYQYKLNKTDELKLIGGAEVKSDELRWTRNTTKYFVSGMWCRQVNERTKIGAGFVASHEMRLTNAYPVLVYDRKLSEKYHLSLYLPKSATLRRKFNSSNYLIAKSQLRGWRYNLTDPLEDRPGDLTLRRADFELSLAWEHELHDWLWVSATVGYNKNLRYYLSEPGKRRRDALQEVSARDARYAKLSIFLVPPRKFMK